MIIVNIKRNSPVRGYYKSNTDGSCLGNPDKGGIGGVFRNYMGDWDLGFHKSNHKATNIQMKL